MRKFHQKLSLGGRLLAGFILALLLGSTSSTYAQDNRLVINLSPSVSTAQSLDLKSLAESVVGGTANEKIFDIIITNNESQSVSGLIISISVELSNGDALIQLNQDRPGFTLKANRTYIGNSNNITDGIPGIEESFNFSASDIDDILTDEGRDFMTDTKGILSNELLICKVTIVDADENIWATEQIVLGSASVSAPVADLFLRSPGDALGNEFIMTNTLPRCSWDGATNAIFRLVVVEDNNADSPEALIQNARSSAPAINQTQSGSKGSLLDFEMVDARLNQSAFDYPPNGVQKLTEGNTYYWQVLQIISGNSGEDEIASEIWEFTLPSKASGESSAQTNAQLTNTVQRILGFDTVSELTEEGYSLETVTINGQEYSQSSEIVRLLIQFANKMNSNEITISN
jgi:hypothetical protein